MLRQIFRMIRNGADVARVRPLPRGAAIVAETFADHRISPRRFVPKMFPLDGVGAELGVFTGLFSTELLRHARPRKAYFVDPWRLAHGARFPDWGRYTAYGRLATADAEALARARIAAAAGGAETKIVVGYSTEFLAHLPDETLDWVYLDSSHSYAGTRDELALLARKLKPGGIVAGDDWHDDREHRHAGVAQAVEESIDEGRFALVGTYPEMQWAARRTDRKSVV